MSSTKLPHEQTTFALLSTAVAYPFRPSGYLLRPAIFESVDDAHAAASILQSADVDYANLGVVRSDDGAEFVNSQFYADVVGRHDKVALAADIMTSDGSAICRNAVKAAAAAVGKIAHLDEEGFSNLRFCALANVLPNGPFFPASYALVDEASLPDADLFVTALGIQGATLINHVVREHIPGAQSAYAAITAAVEEAAKILVAACAPICPVTLDFSTAPMPGAEHSIGSTLALSARTRHFPGPGGLTAAARMAGAIDAARIPRTGYCGIMLPVCEDDALAGHPPSLNELLSCSAVCGTGLDTIPVSGDCSAQAVEAVMTDVGALSARLGGKQLTVRLMPVPGRKAGDWAAFSSPYMSNARVVDIEDGVLAEDVKRDGECTGEVRIDALRWLR